MFSPNLLKAQIILFHSSVPSLSLVKSTELKAKTLLNLYQKKNVFSTYQTVGRLISQTTLTTFSVVKHAGKDILSLTSLSKGDKLNFSD